MKRMLKKLSALALAGAMVLSLGVSALATEPGEPTTIEGTGQSRIIAASGGATGSGSTQGGLPDDVIKIKLPVNAAAGTFNLYFDPHNLIRESGNAMELESADATFANDTLVYFKNKGDTPSFSKTSDAIKVINKSSVPISVSMDATWNKGQASYKLARTAEELADLKAKGQAALFLYVAEDHTDTTSPVVDTTRGIPTVSGGGFTYPKTNAASGTVPSKTANDLVYLNKYLKSIKFEYTDNADADDVQNINYGATGKTPANWQFAIALQNNKTPAVTFSNVGTAIPTYTSYNSSGAATNNQYKATVAAALDVVTANNADGSKSYSIKADANGNIPDPVSVLKIQRGTTGNPDVALITFEWDYEAIAKNGFSLTEKVTADDNSGDYETYSIDNTSLQFQSGSGAKVDTDLNRVDGAYKLGKDEQTNRLARVLNSPYTYDESDDDKWESVSFNLTAAITDGDVCAKAWDTAFTTDADNEGSLSLTWKATPCPDFDPVVKVTSPLTTATGTATVKIDWGVGAKKATAITAASYDVSGTATELPIANIVVNNDTATITSVAGLFNGANGKLTLTFKHADTGYKTKVTVDLKTAAT